MSGAGSGGVPLGAARIGHVRPLQRLFTCVFLLLAACGSSKPDQETKLLNPHHLTPMLLFPDGAPNEIPGAIGPEVLLHNDGTGCGANHSTTCAHIYNVSAPALVPYLVSGGTGSAVVIAPGGGYKDLAWDKEGLDVARWFNSIGVSAFVLKYRVPARPAVPDLPEWWAPLQDAQRAVSMVKAMEGIDPGRVGFIGFSAGGHLSANLATHWRERIYTPHDDIDKLSVRPDFSMLIYPWALLAGNNRWSTSLASELQGMDNGHPVAFFAQNADDPTAFVQNTLHYNLGLAAVGAPDPTVHVYPTGGHAFGLCQGMTHFEQCCEWPKAALRFLQDLGVAEGFPKTIQVSGGADFKDMSTRESSQSDHQFVEGEV